MSAAHNAARALGANLQVGYIEMGVPEQLAHLACEINKHEFVLNDLDDALARKADLKLVWPRWALWLLDVELKKYKTSAPVAALVRRQCEGDLPSRTAWQAAEHEAWAEKTKEAATMAAEVAETVARAALKAEAAAWAAGWGVWALEADTQEVARSRMAEKLKQLLKEAPSL